MNGNLRGEAEYFGDNVNYTGNVGTSTNKYIIEDIYDFIKAIRPEGRTGNFYMRLVNDIDFNDHSTYRNGITSTIAYTNQRYYYLYGYGHKIKNLVAYGNTSGAERNLPFSLCRDVDFENIIMIGHNAPFPIFGTTMENCNFGVFLSNSYIRFSGCTITNSTFNIRGRSSSGFLIYTTDPVSFKQCHFNFDITTTIRNSSNISGFLGGDDDGRSTYKNCYFTGKWTDAGTVIPLLTDAHVTLTNCYFALDYYTKNENKSVTVSSDYSPRVFTCFVDKELFEKNGGIWDVSSITGLTTDQAHDPDYLNSLGFAVVPR